MNKNFREVNQVEQFLGISSDEENKKRISKEINKTRKESRQPVSQPSEYIKFTSLIKKDLKKRVAYHCVEKSLKEYKVIELALENYLKQ